MTSSEACLINGIQHLASVVATTFNEIGLLYLLQKKKRRRERKRKRKRKKEKEKRRERK